MQAYVYIAYQSRAWMAYDAGDLALADELTDRAEQLKKQFNEQFWMPERGYYAIALRGGTADVPGNVQRLGRADARQRGGPGMDPVLPESYGDLLITNAPLAGGRITIDMPVPSQPSRDCPRGWSSIGGTVPG